MTAVAAGLLLYLQADRMLEALADRFRSDRIEERERAFLDLKLLGEAARATVEELARDVDSEIALRAAELLPDLELRGWISPVFLARFPTFARRLNEDDRLARSLLSGSWQLSRSFLWDEEWNAQAFIWGYQLSLWGLVPAADVESMAPAAFLDAFEDETKIYLCGIVEGPEYRSVAPELRRLLRDPEVRVREAALTGLIRVLGVEAAPDLVPLLDDPAEDLRERTFFELDWLASPSAAGALTELLKKKISSPARIDALVLLRRLAEQAPVDDLR